MKDSYSYSDSFNRERHGSLFDRGTADSWYNRSPSPHWYPNGTSTDPRIVDLNEEQIKEYHAGYLHNEEFGDKKDWN